MDFSNFDIGVAAAPQETGVMIDLPQFQNGNGEALSLTMTPPSSPAARRELRKWGLKYGTPAKADPNTGEAALDKIADQAAAADVEFIARMIGAWNLAEKGGAAVPCTLENRVAFFRAFEPVAEAVAVQIADRIADLGNSKPA